MHAVKRWPCDTCIYIYIYLLCNQSQNKNFTNESRWWNVEESFLLAKKIPAMLYTCTYLHNWHQPVPLAHLHCSDRDQFPLEWSWQLVLQVPAHPAQHWKSSGSLPMSSRCQCRLDCCTIWEQCQLDHKQLHWLVWLLWITNTLCPSLTKHNFIYNNYVHVHAIVACTVERAPPPPVHAYCTLE